MENEYDLGQPETLDVLLSATRSTSAASTGIPTPPLPGFCLSSLRRGDVVEIQGPSGSGKTHLLYHLICSCILPLRFGGWNKVSVVFDTDGTFDIHRLQTLLRTHLSHSLFADEITTERIISVALRNVHTFRAKSSAQLAAGLANLSLYHMRSLPTSEIALLAIDSASSFHWFDRLATEQRISGRLMSLATPPPTPSNNPSQTILTTLWNFRRSHYPVILVLNWGLGPFPAAGNFPAQLYPQLLPPFSTLMNRASFFPDPSHTTPLFLTHQITLDLTRVVPFSHSAADEQRSTSFGRQVDIHVHVKTAVDHADLLMQIHPEQVIITVPDIPYATGSEEQ
ncbi:hypothetical protein BJV74DRAFT_886278 [Russula compacta]|nr:hypothetical protein BJV74DRAFT_886278 [Russula compacta]